MCSFSTNAALEIFALDLSSTDLEMPLKGTVSSEHRYINFWMVIELALNYNNINDYIDNIVDVQYQPFFEVAN